MYCDFAANDVVTTADNPESGNVKMNENRQNIICATERLLQTHGLARLTMREIAREAKVAEGLIYHHFKDKAELIHEVVEQRMHDAKNVLQNLPLQVGLRTLSENLEEVLSVVYRSHYEIVPIVCSVFADHQLRARMREIMKEREVGPQHAIDGLAVYLAAEQRLGRMAETVIPQAAAKCLLMISIQTAMDDQLMEQKPDVARIRQEIRQYVQTIMAGLEPRLPAKQKTTFKKSQKS
jgi:AcrR family transcriptional regulator